MPGSLASWKNRPCLALVIFVFFTGLIQSILGLDLPLGSVPLNVSILGFSQGWEVGGLDGAGLLPQVRHYACVTAQGWGEAQVPVGTCQGPGPNPQLSRGSFSHPRASEGENFS